MAGMHRPHQDYHRRQSNLHDDDREGGRTPTPPPMSAPSGWERSVLESIPFPDATEPSGSPPRTAPCGWPGFTSGLAAKVTKSCHGDSGADVLTPKQVGVRSQTTASDAYGAQGRTQTQALNSKADGVRAKDVSSKPDGVQAQVMISKQRGSEAHISLVQKPSSSVATDDETTAIDMSLLDEPARIRVQSYIDELKVLRPRLLEQQGICARARGEVKKLWIAEIKEKKDLWTRQVEMDQKLLHVVTRLQRSFRGYLVRKRLLSLQQGEQAKIAIWASSLPRQLASNLQEMRLECHRLMYREHDRLNAALRLQAWWRCLLARRQALLLRAAAWMRRCHSIMDKAAIRIQSRFRVLATRKTMIAAIHRNIEKRKAAQLKEMEAGHVQIVRIQRRLRVKLSRRRLAEAFAAKRAQGLQVSQATRGSSQVLSERQSSVCDEAPAALDKPDSCSTSVPNHIVEDVVDSPTDKAFEDMFMTGREEVCSIPQTLPGQLIGGASAVRIMEALRRHATSPVPCGDVGLSSLMSPSPHEVVEPPSGWVGGPRKPPPHPAFDDTRGVCAYRKGGDGRKAVDFQHGAPPKGRPLSLPVRPVIPLNSLRRSGRVRLAAIDSCRVISEEPMSHPLLCGAPPLPPPQTPPSYMRPLPP